MGNHSTQAKAPNFFRTASTIAVAVALTGLAYACAGSSGGISGTSSFVGPISGFGSIVVNGIRFNTDAAAVTIEGDSATLEDLKLGMVVLVKGSLTSRVEGIADLVASDHLLLGRVEGVNADDNIFVALSQLVISSDDTVFDATTLETLAADDIVEVFGFLDADGSIRATRVERLDELEEIELAGTISQFNDQEKTFQLGALRVHFSDAIIEGADAQGLRNGLIVEVEAETDPVDDVLEAVGIEVRAPNFLADTGDGVDIEGFVTSTISPERFVINAAQTVSITSRTRYERGTAADLVLNAHVEIEGTIAEDGSLQATEIEFIED